LQTIQKPQVKSAGRLDYIDKASGLAIVSVVYAHILFPETMSINWYLRSENFIYKFHMPLFMCLSGYLAFLSTASKKIVTSSAYLNFQKKKIVKFLPVYFIFSLYSILVDVFYHHASLSEVNQSIYSFFFTPTLGSAVFVWYIYVLMGFYLITPFLLNLKTSTQYFLL
jgi:fucose 4-O-acetylase-like acetyltransferase